MRVRFAPSPTGNLHIGTVRTALFNYLFAKATGATTVLRIEDTDLSRSNSDYEASIMAGLEWLKIVPDEGPHAPGPYGPYRQSERQDTYTKALAQLRETGAVYPCFCTPEALDAERVHADAEKKPYVYSGKCRHLTKPQQEAEIATGKPFAYKFHVPDHGPVTFIDLIRDQISFDSRLIGDFVLMKSDGTPSYNFAVVVDDSAMAITHVIRGEDHISNTPKQILLFQALGASIPQFAHLPMILGPDKSKLSKRHGATSVTDYREEGYLADAMFNYLALLGWSSPDEQELMSREDIASRFSLDRISKSGAIFDTVKLKWMNGHYIRQLPQRDFFEQAWPYITQENQALLAYLDSENQEKALFSVRDNITLLPEINTYLGIYTMSDTAFQTALNSLQWNDSDLQVITAFKTKWDMLADKPLLDTDIEALIASIVTETGLGKGKVYKPIRLATSGLGNGPHIATYLSIFGHKKVSHRLKLGPVS